MENQLILFFTALTAIFISGTVLTVWKNIRKKHIIVVNDHGTYQQFWLVVPGCILLSLLAFYTGWGNLHFSIFCVSAGFLLVVAGLIIRWWAILSLRLAYTVQVSIVTDHQLKTDGIYKIVRHPTYSGMLMYYCGLGITMHNWIGIVLLIIGPWAVTLNRIKKEEKMLIQHFGDAYLEYSAHTDALIPLVY